MKFNFKNLPLCIASFTLVMTNSPSLANSAERVTSKYTGISESDCLPFESDEESDYVASRCPGLGGVRVDFIYSDAREDLELSTPDAGHMRLGLPGVLGGGFNTLPGKKLEWRGRLDSDDRFSVFALIVRTRSLHGDPAEQSREALVVYRFTPFQICYVGQIDAKAQANGHAANELARQLADKVAASFPCGPN